MPEPDSAEVTTVPVKLLVTAGPFAGKEFAFDRHDTLLVGRATDAHLQVSADDQYFSRRHFLLEVNPPRVRVIDLNSRNGIFVNGTRVTTAELRHGDEIAAGHTVFRLESLSNSPDDIRTIDLPATPAINESRVLSLVAKWRERADAGNVVPAQEICPANAPHLLPRLREMIEEDRRFREALQGAMNVSRLVIPGYRLGPELGRGGMGVVYRAVRAADGVPVAVKTVIPAPGVSPRQVEKFLREARILAALDHPHVVTHLDSGASAGAVYLVMELIDGTDARRLLADRGPLPVPTAVRLTCGVLSALGHAHDRGIVHRDVKPGNVLIGGPSGRRVVKLADFGLARAYDECKLSGLTFQGEVGGTPAFMAPEQVTHYRTVKPAADQYAAAATLYNLLTAAYTHDLPRDIGGQLVAVVSADPISIRDRRPDLPAALAEVVHRGLAREPGDRYSDVQAFRKALLPFAR